MVNFERTVFGSVYVDGKSYSDILVVNDKVEPREREKLEQIFGTSHMVVPAEVSKLTGGNPDVILIGSGQSGVLKVADEVKDQIEKGGAKLIVLETPEAIYKYNELVKKGKKVNALIHVTC